MKMYKGNRTNSPPILVNLSYELALKGNANMSDLLRERHFLESWI